MNFFLVSLSVFLNQLVAGDLGLENKPLGSYLSLSKNTVYIMAELLEARLGEERYSEQRQCLSKSTSYSLAFPHRSHRAINTWAFNCH